MKSQSFLKKVSALLTLLLAVFLISPQPATAELLKLKLAFQGPLTGPEAVIGIEQMRAANYAITKFNQSHLNSIQVELTMVDDQGSPSIAVPLSQKVSQSADILGLIGPSYSGATRASLPAYRAAGLPVISPSATNVTLTDPISTSSAPGTFHRTAYSDNYMGMGMAKLIYAGITDPRPYLVAADDAYSQVIINTLKNMGVTFVATSTIVEGTTNFANEVAKVKATGANVVVYPGYAQESSKLVNQLREGGYTGRIVLSDGSADSQFLSQVAIKNTSGIFLTTSQIPASALSAVLKSDYKLITGYDASDFTANTIDAINVFLSCFEKGATTRPLLASCVNSFSGKNLLGETFSFTNYGDLQGASVPTLTVTNGKFTYIKLTDLLPPPTKPNKPIINNISYKDGKVQVSVTLTDAELPESAYLLIPSLSTEKIIATIQGNIATWLIDVTDQMFGKALGLSLVSIRKGLESDPLDGSVDIPTKELVMLDQVTQVPKTPKDLSNSSTGSIQVISVTVDQSASSMAATTAFYSPALKISKDQALAGSISGDRAFFNIPIAASMVGKTFAFSIFSVNKIGESKELKGTFSIPAKKSAVSTGIKCSKSSQIRTFTSKTCPPGWKKA